MRDGSGRRWVEWVLAPAIVSIAALDVATAIEVRAVPLGGLVAMPFLLVGAVVLRKVGSHAVGWLLLSLGITLQVTTFDSVPWLSPLWIGWITTWGFMALFAQFAWLLIVFPDGRPPNKAWRWAGILASVMVLTGLLTPDIRDGATNQYLGPNPTGLSFVPAGAFMLGFLVISGVLISAAVGVFIRGRQAPAVERARYKVVEAALLVFGVVVTSIVVPTALWPALYRSLGGENIWGVVLIFYVIIPVAFGVAITRYRLYDIDKIISRTITYALVVAVVALVYAVPVVLVSSVVGGSRALVTAAATLAAAAVFNPIRRQIQRRVERRFDRARYDAEREVAAFAAQLGPRHSIEGLAGELADLLQRTLHPQSSRLWLRTSAGVGSRNDSGTHHA